VTLNVAFWPVALVDGAVKAGTGKIPRPTRRKVTEPLSSKAESKKRTSAKLSAEQAQIPIVLVHGYFHNRSGLLYMERALRRHGFANVQTFSYNPLRKSIPDMAAKLQLKIDAIKKTTGAPKVYLVGHSLGGLICRYYTEQLGGHRMVDTLVTVGTPHHGTVIAYAGRSASARQMRPNSDFMQAMQRVRKPRSVRYISYYSNLDAIVVPAHSAILENGNGSSVKNILVHDQGHLSLLVSPELIASIASNLTG
jgi:triacylglycerol lipase